MFEIGSAHLPVCVTQRPCECGRPLLMVERHIVEEVQGRFSEILHLFHESEHVTSGVPVLGPVSLSRIRSVVVDVHPSELVECVIPATTVIYLGFDSIIVDMGRVLMCIPSLLLETFRITDIYGQVVIDENIPFSYDDTEIIQGHVQLPE